LRRGTIREAAKSPALPLLFRHRYPPVVRNEGAVRKDEIEKVNAVHPSSLEDGWYRDASGPSWTDGRCAGDVADPFIRSQQLRSLLGTADAAKDGDGDGQRGEGVTFFRRKGIKARRRKMASRYGEFVRAMALLSAHAPTVPSSLPLPPTSNCLRVLNVSLGKGPEGA
jgi:hypothetical protein